jgi:tetratricopeptide (TPR) repeat protein
MNRFFLKYRKAIVGAIVVTFVLGIVGGSLFRRFSPSQRGSQEEVVLVVEGEKFTRRDLGVAYRNLINYYIQLYQAFGQDFNQQLQGTEGVFNQMQYLASAAEGLIRDTLIRRGAREYRVPVPASQLNQATEESYRRALERFGGSEDALAEYLRRYQGLTLEQFRAQLRAAEELRLLEEGLRRQVVGPIQPTQDDLLAYLQEHQDRYQTEPEKIRLAYLKVSDAALADELLAQAQQPETDFLALAQEHSEDPEVELDWFARGESPLPRAVEEVAFSLSEGEVRLVEEGGAFYVLKLLGHRPPVIPPLEEIRERVEEDYIRDEESQRWNDWYQARRQSARIEVNDPLLEAFLLYPTDKQAALEALQVAGQEPEPSPYLPYFIGRVHEALAAELETRLAELEEREELTPEEQAELARLAEEIDHHQREALQAYLAFATTSGVELDEEFFQRALALDPQNAQLRLRLADLYLEQGQYFQAEREYGQALEAQPGLLAAVEGQGDVALAMGLYARAVERYRAALETQTPSQTPERRLELELKLAGALVRDEQYQEARPLLENILRQRPEHTGALILMGDLCLGEGDPAQAVGYYQTALRRSPTPDTQLKLARALLESGDLDAAQAEYEELLDWPTPTYKRQAHVGMGDVMRARGDTEQALEYYRLALRLAGADAAEKEAIAEKILELSPEDLEMRFRLASYYREQYKYDAAIAQYQAILAQAPGDVDALIGLGDCYVPKTEYDTAISYYQQALEQTDNPRKQLQIYGKIVECEERRVGPTGELTQVALEALWQAALIHHQLGNTDQARQALQRIYDADPSFRAQELVPLLLELGGEVQTPPQVSEPPAQTPSETSPGG